MGIKSEKPPPWNSSNAGWNARCANGSAWPRARSTKIKKKAYQRKVREAQKNVREFIGEHEDMLRRDYWREKTYGIPLEKSQKDAILNAEIKRDAGIRGVLHLDLEPIEIEALQFDDEHINLQRKHSITQEQAQEMIKNAKASVTVWNGRFERYYSDQGVVYVDREKQAIRTAFGPEEFDDKVKKILEVLKRYGR